MNREEELEVLIPLQANLLENLREEYEEITGEEYDFPVLESVEVDSEAFKRAFKYKRQKQFYLELNDEFTVDEATVIVKEQDWLKYPDSWLTKMRNNGFIKNTGWGKWEKINPELVTELIKTSLDQS